MTPGRRLFGLVVAFDDTVGLGEIEGEGEPAVRYPFHCTQIADGTRVVGVGAVVSFGLLAGRGGRWEAADIRAGAGRPGAVAGGLGAVGILGHVGGLGEVGGLGQA